MFHVKKQDIQNIINDPEHNMADMNLFQGSYYKIKEKIYNTNDLKDVMDNRSVKSKKWSNWSNSSYCKSRRSKVSLCRK